MHTKSNYHPESYWSEVGGRIASRNDQNIIAGDDEPYYRYKRNRFLELLNSVDYKGKKVLEIGCGPGGNLNAVYQHQPEELVGVDISAQMVELASSNCPKDVKIHKIDGTSLPFEDKYFDIVFTATVLQHNTDEAMLKKIMAELSRVAKKHVMLFERVESTILGDDLCLGRPVNYFADIMKDSGFKLQDQRFINVRASYYVSGAIRVGLNPQKRREGEPINKLSVLLQKLTLPFTKILDKLWTSKKDVAKMQFVRQNS